MRIIHAPNAMMKILLRRINDRFLSPMHLQLGPHVTAYRKGQSVTDAVKQHIPACPSCDAAPKGVTLKKHPCPRRGVYIKLDLRDFFHRTRRAWIRNYFKSLGYSHTVAGILSGLLVVQGQTRQNRNPHPITPQGSPASGTICNLVAAQRLDPMLLTYLEGLNARYGLNDDWRWVYSRYSDDLVFTCGVNPPKHECVNILRDIKQIITEAGYAVNHKKTKVTGGYHHKNMLGIVFNDKANYARKEYLQLRAIIHNCKTYGFTSQVQQANQCSAEALMEWLRGKINWVTQINPEKGQALLQDLQVALTQQNERVL
jgi:hypothetical protein